MQRAAVYVRVSSDKQTTDNQGAAAELARARGFEPELYAETMSAAKARPVLDRLMTDARAGKVRAVVVVALDRLDRSMVGAINRVIELDRLGVRVLSVRESWLDTDPGNPTRLLLLAIFGWVAEQERRVLIERTRAGLDRARRAGVQLGRPRASPVMLGAAADEVSRGRSIRAAARGAGMKEATLRRFLARKAKGGAETPATPSPRAKNPA